MAFTLNPSLSESYLVLDTTPRVARPVDPYAFSSRAVRVGSLNPVDPLAVVNNVWLKELTGVVEVVTPLNGTPEFTGISGGGGGGSTRPSTGLVYPRGV